MSSSRYRCYRPDSPRELRGAEWLDAQSDEQGIAKVSARHPDSKCEIWHGTRLVAAISPRQLRA
jgi:hypothetical protein